MTETANDDTMIKFDNVSKKYPHTQDALKNVSFEVGKGEMAFLTGHSGAGKSSVLKLVALTERPSQGDVFVNGYHNNALSRGQIPKLRRSLGIVFQNPMLLKDHSVFDNVALPLIIAGGMRSNEIRRRVRAALDKVGLMHKEKRYPDTLSCGEQQRVGIARAIVTKPPVLLADEPTGNLDPELSLEIMKLFEQFNQVGVTILVATHDINLISSLGHRVLRLNRGALQNEEATVNEPS